jgi:hypothetical protein
LAEGVIAAGKPEPVSGEVKKLVRLAGFLCVVGVGLLVWGIGEGLVDRSVLGGFLLVVGVAGYFQERKKAPASS